MYICAKYITILVARTIPRTTSLYGIILHWEIRVVWAAHMCTTRNYSGSKRVFSCEYSLCFPLRSLIINSHEEWQLSLQIWLACTTSEQHSNTQKSVSGMFVLWTTWQIASPIQTLFRIACHVYISQPSAAYMIHWFKPPSVYIMALAISNHALGIFGTQ